MRTIDSEDLRDDLEGFDATEATNREKLELAQSALQFAIGLLEEVADATRDEHARAYMVDHLKILASADHGFLSRDFNLDEWIEQVEAGDENE